MGKSVCFTGHRPEKLMNIYDENSSIITYIKDELYNNISKAIADGFDTFYSGMARGIDIYASETMLELKNKFKHIKHVAVIPYSAQSEKWSISWRRRYEKILLNSDIKILLSDEYYSGCLTDRNIFMIENSDRLIAVFNGTAGGTFHTINLAKKSNKEIFLIKI